MRPSFIPILLFLAIWLQALPGWSQGQEDYSIDPDLTTGRWDSITVEHIFISGNVRTKARIITRELSFGENSRLPIEGMADFLQLERNKIYNTNLFTKVNLALRQVRADTAALFVTVNEELYILPVPILEIADRSFTEWWANQNRDLRRLNYGLDLQLRNFRGRRERLKTKFKLGFTRSASLDYEIPYINRAQTNGLRFRAKYSENRDVAFTTTNNKQDFWPADTVERNNILWKQYSGSVAFTRRKGFFLTQSFSLGFAQDDIDDTVRALNPNYLATGSTRQRYFNFEYQIVYDKRDIRVFPLDGLYLSAKLDKKGLGVFGDLNLLELHFKVGKFIPLGKRLFWSSALSGKFTLPNEVPFVESRALGFGQLYVRGFDQLVMEGAHAILNRNNLRFKLLDVVLDFGKWMPIRQLNQIPFRIYPKVYLDWGKAWNPSATPENGDLYNRTLTSMGVGVDLISSYERVMRIEYALVTIPSLAAENRGVFISFISDF